MSSAAARAARIARFSHRAAGRRRVTIGYAKLHAAIYRATGGRLMRGWFGAPVIVLETVGRRSGQTRATPVVALRRGDDLVVMAANAGSDRTPAWWLNLRGAGRGTAVRSGRRQHVRPRVAEGPERDELLERFLAMYPPAEHYPGYTERDLPLIVLEPLEPDAAPPEEAA